MNTTYIKLKVNNMYIEPINIEEEMFFHQRKNRVIILNGPEHNGTNNSRNLDSELKLKLK